MGRQTDGRWTHGDLSGWMVEQVMDGRMDGWLDEWVAG